MHRLVLNRAGGKGLPARRERALPLSLGGAVLAALLCVPSAADQMPYPTDRPPSTAFTPKGKRFFRSKEPPQKSPANQWRKKDSTPAPATGETSAETQEGGGEVPAEGGPTPEWDKDQWRKTPADRRWQSWRKFPVAKQVELWRDLSQEERQSYWDRMNVHERATLWGVLEGPEKDFYWGKTPEADRALLVDQLPPQEKKAWEPRLEDARPARPDEQREKFKPATPEPGYTPKSMYREDDE